LKTPGHLGTHHSLLVTRRYHRIFTILCRRFFAFHFLRIFCLIFCACCRKFIFVVRPAASLCYQTAPYIIFVLCRSILIYIILVTENITSAPLFLTFCFIDKTMKYMLIFYRVTGRYISLYLNHHIDVNFKLSLNHNSQTLHNATKHLAELTLVFITYEFYCAFT